MNIKIKKKLPKKLLFLIFGSLLFIFALVFFYYRSITPVCNEILPANLTKQVNFKNQLNSINDKYAFIFYSDKTIEFFDVWTKLITKIEIPNNYDGYTIFSASLSPSQKKIALSLWKNPAGIEQNKIIILDIPSRQFIEMKYFEDTAYHSTDPLLRYPFWLSDNDFLVVVSKSIPGSRYANIVQYQTNRPNDYKVIVKENESPALILTKKDQKMLFYRDINDQFWKIYKVSAFGKTNASETESKEFKSIAIQGIWPLTDLELNKIVEYGRFLDDHPTVNYYELLLRGKRVWVGAKCNLTEISEAFYDNDLALFFWKEYGVVSPTFIGYNNFLMDKSGNFLKFGDNSKFMDKILIINVKKDSSAL